MAGEVPENVQRWTSKRRTSLVVSILKGETSAKEAARKHGLTVGEIEGWQEQFLRAGENSLRSRPRDEEGQKEHEIKQLKQKIGDLVMDLEILNTAIKLKEEREGRPFFPRTSEE